MTVVGGGVFFRDKRWSTKATTDTRMLVRPIARLMMFEGAETGVTGVWAVALVEDGEGGRPVSTLRRKDGRCEGSVNSDG